MLDFVVKRQQALPVLPLTLARLAADSPLFIRRTVALFCSGTVLEVMPSRLPSDFDCNRPACVRLFHDAYANVIDFCLSQRVMGS